MTFQPDEPFGTTNDDDEFNNIEEGLKLSTYFQAGLCRSDNSDGDGPSSSIIDFITSNFLDEISMEDDDFIDRTSLGQLFPEAVLGESGLVDPFDVPINEITITTTTSEIVDENTASNDTRSDATSVPDAVEPMIENVAEKIHLKSVDRSTQKNLLSVKVHPASNPRRPRYQAEGTRRIKRIREKPMTLNLSKLQKYRLDDNQSLWLRLSLTSVNTDADNPLHDIHTHPDKLRIYSGAQQILQDQSVCIPVEESAIIQGELEVKDLSIIKRTLATYDFKLIPYSLSEASNAAEAYVIDPRKTAAANAKIFRKKFNLKASRIVCQILIKENESWHFTDITCLTNIMIEEEYNPETAKRSAKNKRKRRNTKKSKSAKCKTRSSN